MVTDKTWMIQAVYGVINVGEGKTLDDNDLCK